MHECARKHVRAHVYPSVHDCACACKFECVRAMCVCVCTRACSYRTLITIVSIQPVVFCLLLFSWGFFVCLFEFCFVLGWFFFGGGGVFARA